MRGHDDVFFLSSMSGMDKVDFWATRNTRSMCAAGYLRQRRFGAPASPTRELRDDGQEKRRRFICHEYGFMNFLSTLEMYIRRLEHAVILCFLTNSTILTVVVRSLYVPICAINIARNLFRPTNLVSNLEVSRLSTAMNDQ